MGRHRITCQFCGEKFHPMGLKTHEAHCTANPSAKTEMSARRKEAIAANLEKARAARIAKTNAKAPFIPKAAPAPKVEQNLADMPIESIMDKIEQTESYLKTLRRILEERLSHRGLQFRPPDNSRNESNTETERVVNTVMKDPLYQGFDETNNH